MSFRKKSFWKLGIQNLMILLGIGFFVNESQAGRVYPHPGQLIYNRVQAFGADTPITQTGFVTNPNNRDYNALCADPANPAVSAWPIGAGGENGYDIPIGGIPTLRQCYRAWSGGRMFSHSVRLILTNKSLVPQPVSVRVSSLGQSIVPNVALMSGLSSAVFPAGWTSSLFVFCIATAKTGTLPVVSTTASRSIAGGTATGGAVFSGSAVFHADIAANDALGCVLGQNFTPTGTQELAGSGVAQIEFLGGYNITVESGTNLGGIQGRMSSGIELDSQIAIPKYFELPSPVSELFNSGRPF